MSRHSHLYKTARWRKRRLAQLQAEPLCRYCQQQGKTTAATVADHATPHRGDEALFWGGELQSLCAEHHSATKQREEHRGHAIGCDPSGYPLDPEHPWHR